MTGLPSRSADDDRHRPPPHYRRCGRRLELEAVAGHEGEATGQREGGSPAAGSKGDGADGEAVVVEGEDGFGRGGHIGMTAAARKALWKSEGPRHMELEQPLGRLGLARKMEGDVDGGGTGYTAELIAARESYLAGASGLAELTGTAQTCVSLWEHAFQAGDVTGTAMLDRAAMAMLGRSLALRGEAVFLIRDRLIPCVDWEVSTRLAEPRAYRLGIADSGGGTRETALAGEVLHVRIAADPAAPWAGQAPLRRAQMSAQLLNAVEGALAEVYSHAPLGSLIVPFPEAEATDLEKLGRGFRGRRGRVLLRESVQVSAAGGPAPSHDWKPQDVSPDLSRSMTAESLEAARSAVALAFGVLPCLLIPGAQGPAIREAQRHLAMWTLQPIAFAVAEEATAKLGLPVEIDLLRQLQAWDVGGRARAFAGLIEGMAAAKQNGLTPGEVAAALRLVDLEE